MTYEYAAENHDWDLTLRASWCLLMIGQTTAQGSDFDQKNECIFSSYVGSMLLSFCAIESFTTSVAFSMPSTGRFPKFSYENYRQKNRFWEKIQYLAPFLDLEIDKGQGLFQLITEMQNWRNSLTHASPYAIETTPIQNTINQPKKLHKPYHNKEYPRSVHVENAKKFYSAACDYVDLIKAKSGLEPRSSCSYKPAD